MKTIYINYDCNKRAQPIQCSHSRAQTDTFDFLFVFVVVVVVVYFCNTRHNQFFRGYRIHLCIGPVLSIWASTLVFTDECASTTLLAYFFKPHCQFNRRLLSESGALIFRQITKQLQQPLGCGQFWSGIEGTNKNHRKHRTIDELYILNFNNGVNIFFSNNLKLIAHRM